MDGDELLSYECLYQTIVDCYKVATGQWKYFILMEWHRHHDAESILETARQYVRGWVESDYFSDLLMYFNYKDPAACVAELVGVLEGKRNTEVKELLKQIGKERDARRIRG